MRPVAFEEVVPLDRYAELRDAYRQAIIDHKRNRRVAVGEHVTLVFEDRETLRFQIQEMVWIERISDEGKVRDEIDVYNELVPGERELTATMFIEITDPRRIRSELDRLIGIDEHVALLLGRGRDEQRVAALFDPKQLQEDRISAVHYLRFRLDEAGATRFADASVPARICIDHPNYRREAEIDAAVRRSLCETLAGGPASLMPELDPSRRPSSAEDLFFETERVRALRVPGTLRVVVEPRAHVSLFEADAQLLAEILAAVKRAAATLLREGGCCRIWTEIRREGGAMRWHVDVEEP